MKNLVTQAKSEYNKSYYQDNKEHIMQMRKVRYQEDEEYKRLVHASALARERLSSLARKKDISKGLTGGDIAFIYGISPTRIRRLEDERILFNVFTPYTLNQVKLIGFVLQRLRSKPKIKKILKKYKYCDWEAVRREVSRECRN